MEVMRSIHATTLPLMSIASLFSRREESDLCCVGSPSLARRRLLTPTAIGRSIATKIEDSELTTQNHTIYSRKTQGAIP